MTLLVLLAALTFAAGCGAGARPIDATLYTAHPRRGEPLLVHFAGADRFRASVALDRCSTRDGACADWQQTGHIDRFLIDTKHGIVVIGTDGHKRQMSPQTVYQLFDVKREGRYRLRFSAAGHTAKELRFEVGVNARNRRHVQTHADQSLTTKE